MENNAGRLKYADIRAKKGRRSTSRSPVRTEHKKVRDHLSPSRRLNRSKSRSRSRSPVPKRKKHADEKKDRHSPRIKSSAKNKRRSPSPNRKKNRKEKSPPRSPSPIASPSPPRSPSPANDELVTPASPANSSASSSGSSRQRPRTSSRQEHRRDKKERRGRKRSGEIYDDIPDFDGDEANGGDFGDEKYPDIGEIYEAVVAAIKPFGFFSLLMGLRHKYYGLVHISEMKRDGYVTDVQEVVQVGQSVYVKVISNQPKIALSLKDVDQETGEDIDVRRTLKLMEDPDFLDKEKTVRQNRANGLVISGLQFPSENEFKDLIANLLNNEMNLPAVPEHIGYCQPVQGIEFRKKGSTTQLVKIRFYEDDSVPYNRDDVLSRYMTLRNTNMWRHKEIVLNPELRTMGPPRPRLRESLLQPADFLPQAPADEDEPGEDDESAANGSGDAGLHTVQASEEAGSFIPLPQVTAGSDDSDDDDLKLPKRPLPSSGTSSKPFSQELVSQIVSRARANISSLLKPTTRFELPRTFTSMPPPPPVSLQSSAPSVQPAATPVSTSIASSSAKQPNFHSAPPPPVNLPSTLNLSVPPPKLTINIAGVPKSGTSSQLQQLQAAATGESAKTSTNSPATVQYPSLQQQLNHQTLQQQLQQPPPFTTGALPSHLAALQQQLQGARFATPPPLIRPPGALSSANAGAGPAAGGQFPFNIPPLLSAPSGQRSLGPYTNSAQAQQHLQQLLSTMTAAVRPPANMYAQRPESSNAAGIPPLFNPGQPIPVLSHQQSQHKLQSSQQQQQQQSTAQNPYLQGLQQASSWQSNPYSLAASMSSPPSSQQASRTNSNLAPVRSISSTSTSSSKEKEKEKEPTSSPGEISQLLSMAKKLGFNIKTPTSTE